MARNAEGWQLYANTRTGIYQARFTHGGRRRSFSTGERDPRPAAEAAARIYAEVISGRWTPGRELLAPAGRPFDEVAALWLADVEPTIDPGTFGIYRDVYVGTHFAPFFETIDRLTTISAEDYIAARLRKVTRHTVNKEISVLRRLAKWAHRRGYLETMPEIEAVSARVIGAPVTDARKRHFLIFTPAEIARIIAHLPEHAVINGTGEKLPVRARFQVAWETGLRPATLDKIRVPEHYRPGSVSLTVTDGIDKNRFRRELPLSEAARAALDSVCPAEGRIFGPHDYRTPLRAAAKAAGIDEFRAERISPYDFRHSRLTHLGQVTPNLSGVMYLAGHRQPSTTAKYMRPQRAAAEEVLQAAGGAGSAIPQATVSLGKAKARQARGPVKAPDRTTRKEEFWRHTGDTKAGEKSEKSPQDSRDVQRSEKSDLFDLVSVELMGIEPTASRVRF